MPQFDSCHHQVVRALYNAGWRTEGQQVRISFGRRRVFVDVRAVREINGSRQQIMLVEVKCFPDRETIVPELYMAIGQYIVYRAILAELEQEIPLYLCIPEGIFNATFDAPIQRAIRESQIKIVVVNLEAERIVQWIEQLK